MKTIRKSLGTRSFYWAYVVVLALGAVLHLAALTTVPAGLHSDEAFHMLRALDILKGVDLPRYITGNQGNEPLMAYLAAVVIAIVGPVPWASRLVSALASLVALAATIRVGRELAPGRRVALAAGLVWCTLSWALTVGRLGTQPMLAVMAGALTMAGLWAGLRSGRLGDFALGGLGLGLGLDAYVAFRLFPLIPFVTWVAAWWMAPRERRRGYLLGGLAFAGVALLVYAPVASFFVQYPEWFFNRFNQVTDSTLGSTTVAGTLLDGWWRSITGLFWSGDVNVRHNLPGRPGLDVAQTLLFAIGLIAVLRRWRNAASASLMAWLVIGIAPGALTDSAPHFLRMAAITPALALVTGFGADALLSRKQPGGQWSAAGLGLAWVASSAVAVRLVFTSWTSGYEANYLFDQPPLWIAQQLRAAPVGTRTFVSPIPRDNYTIEYVLGPERFADLDSFNGRECSVIPEQSGALPPLFAVYTGEDKVTPDALRAAYPDLEVAAENVWTGTAQATIYRLPVLATAADTPRQRLSLRFGDRLALSGWEAIALEVGPGMTLRFDTHWLVTTPTDANWVMFAHLRGDPMPDGNVVYAQRDSEPCDESYPTWRWRPAERIVEHTHIELPPDLAPGTYSLYIGWYDRQAQVRLPISDDTGTALGDDLRLAEVVIR